jgi:hypothetical protein
MSDQSEFICFELKQDQVSFQGVNDCGMVTDKISHKVLHDHKEVTNAQLSVLFVKKILKVVTATHQLHKMLKVAFNQHSMTADPILFSYSLDHEQPQSHFSVYVMPMCL